MISVVSPVYGCVDALPELVRRVSTVMSQRGEPFEIVLVNDGSPDDSWKVIQDLSQQFPWVKGLSLSRNFGQHPAILAGVSAACGDCIVVMENGSIVQSGKHESMVGMIDSPYHRLIRTTG